MDDMRSLLQRFTFSIWRKRWIALAIAWVLCIAGWFAVAAIPNQYEASSRIYVDSDAVLTPLLRGLALDNTPTSQLDLLEHTVLSRPNLEKLISKTDLELSVSGPADLERLVFSLADNIKITPQTRNLFTISYRTTSAKLAYDVVQTMLTIFIESKTGTNRTDMENAKQFLDQQITQYEQKLRLSEAKRAEFRIKYMDLLPQDANGGLSHLEAARNSLAQLQEKLKDAQQHRDLVKQQLDATPEMLDPGDAEAVGLGGGGNTLLQDAQRHLAELKLKYTDQHPDVIAARQMIEQLKSGALADSAAASATAAAPRPAGARLRGIPNPVHEQLKLQMLEADSAIATLQRQIADQTKDRDKLEAIARGVPGLMAEYADLNRDYDVLRKNHEELLSRREEMRIASAADTEAEKVKLEVVDPPQVPQNPVAPKRVLMDTAVLALGLAGGIGFAMMLLQFDSSFQTVDELRKLDLPVAGSISLIAAAVPLHRRMLSLSGFAVAVLLLCAVWGGLVFKMMRSGIA
jgi:polysaccharide chain length determinant protein (PEP-CTERM system associated)